VMTLAAFFILLPSLPAGLPGKGLVASTHHSVLASVIASDCRERGNLVFWLGSKLILKIETQPCCSIQLVK
jgi:hypothetical protein